MTDRFKLRKKIGGGYCEPYNHIEAVMREHSRMLFDKFEKALVAKIKERLLIFGYAFDSEPEFLTFCKLRITRVSEGSRYEVRLDYESGLRPGALLVYYDTTITCDISTGFSEDRAVIVNLTIG